MDGRGGIYDLLNVWSSLIRICNYERSLSEERRGGSTMEWMNETKVKEFAFLDDLDSVVLRIDLITRDLIDERR